MDNAGDHATTSFMNSLFIELLVDVFREQPHLFPEGITCEDDIGEAYNVFRSMRRGSVSRSAAMKVSEDDQYAENRWSKKEKGKGRMAMPIKQVYIDVSLLEPNFVRYTYAM